MSVAKKALPAAKSKIHHAKKPAQKPTVKIKKTKLGISLIIDIKCPDAAYLTKVSVILHTVLNK